MFLLLWAGINTLAAIRDWLRLPEVYIHMEQHLNQASAFVKRYDSEGLPVYFSPYSPSHPDIGFNAARLSPRQVGAFDSRFCMVISRSASIFISLDMLDPDFQARLSRLADTEILAEDSLAPEPRYRVYRAVPHQELSSGWQSDDDTIVFADTIMVRAVSALPASSAAGETIPIDLAFQTMRPLDRVYGLFVHLYGHPTPYEGGPLLAQADSWVCASYPSIYWKHNEVIVQHFDLTVPAQIPAGSYTISIGLYDVEDGARQPITRPAQPEDYFTLAELNIAQAQDK